MNTMGIACAALAASMAAGGTNAQPNALTEAERLAGYQLLFNGTDLTGWRAWNSAFPPASWTVKAESTGNVLYIQSGSPIASLITSDQSFRNFDLLIEWSIGPAGESGIHIRYDKFNVDSWGGASGPEAQIAAANNANGTMSRTRSGACYDMFPLEPAAAAWDGTPNYGRWQRFRIIAYENHVAHFGNGMKLLEYVIGSPEWNTAYNSSKYFAFPDYGTIHPGAIYLEHRGENGPAGPKFRNIRIKKLTKNPWAQGSPYLVDPGDTTRIKDLDFADLLLETPTSRAAGRLPAGALGLAAYRDGYRIRFPSVGDYRVELRDGMGRSLRAIQARNAGEAWLPSTAAKGHPVLSVWSGETRIHAGSLPVR